MRTLFSVWKATASAVKNHSKYPAHVCALAGCANSMPTPIANSLADLPCDVSSCSQLYSSPDPAERRVAEEALVHLSSSVEHIPQCQFVLDNSQQA